MRDDLLSQERAEEPQEEQKPLQLFPALGELVGDNRRILRSLRVPPLSWRCSPFFHLPRSLSLSLSLSLSISTVLCPVESLQSTYSLTQCTPRRLQTRLDPPRPPATALMPGPQLPLRLSGLPRSAGNPCPPAADQPSQHNQPQRQRQRQRHLQLQPCSSPAGSTRRP